MCAESCKYSCRSISLHQECQHECVEGCSCQPGYTLDNTGISGYTLDNTGIPGYTLDNTGISGYTLDNTGIPGYPLDNTGYTIDNTGIPGYPSKRLNPSGPTFLWHL